MPRTKEVDERLGELLERPAAVAEEQRAAPVAVSDTRIAELEAMVKQLGEQLVSVLRAGVPRQPQKDFGPPPPARKSLPFIKIMVNQYSQVIRQVPQEYIDQKQPGWDGEVVKAYINHERSTTKRK